MKKNRRFDSNKTKPIQSQLPGFGRKLEIPDDQIVNIKLKLVNRAVFRPGDLKKQSQFMLARIGTKSYMKGGYGNMPARGAEQNKANSKPNKANFSFPRRPKSVEAGHGIDI